MYLQSYLAHVLGQVGLSIPIPISCGWLVCVCVCVCVGGGGGGGGVAHLASSMLHNEIK